MFSRNGTGGVTENAIAGLEFGWRRLPSARESIAQKLIRRWLMGPHGDRRDGSQSGRIEAQEGWAERQNHVMSELVLSNDLSDLNSWRLLGCPAQQICEREASGEDYINVSQDAAINSLCGADGYGPHEDSYGAPPAWVSGMMYSAHPACRAVDLEVRAQSSFASPKQAE
jgi:hypothetical protein